MSDFVIENGVLTKYTGPGGDVVVPEGVKEIGKRAFDGCKDLQSVAFPEGLAKIGWGPLTAARTCRAWCSRRG